jgi:hypothetical protein
LIRIDAVTTIPIIKHNPTTIDNVIHNHNSDERDDDSVAILFVVKKVDGFVDAVDVDGENVYRKKLL